MVAHSDPVDGNRYGERARTLDNSTASAFAGSFVIHFEVLHRNTSESHGGRGRERSVHFRRLSDLRNWWGNRDRLRNGASAAAQTITATQLTIPNSLLLAIVKIGELAENNPRLAVSSEIWLQFHFGMRVSYSRYKCSAALFFTV